VAKSVVAVIGPRQPDRKRAAEIGAQLVEELKANEVQPVVQEQPQGSTMAPLMFQSPAALTKALDAYCTQHNLSRASVIRAALADKIGFVLQPEHRAKRPSKYGSEAEKKAANRARSKQKRDETKAIVDKIRAARKLADMEALAKSIGIELEDV
jgi:hypothetical protein